MKFDEKKTTQLAALLLNLKGSSRMHYIKLIKLLYLIDREALLRWGRPVTYDNYVSMNKGPVLSRTLNLITEEQMPGQESYWLKYIISEPNNYEVMLKSDPGQKELSDAEIELAKKVFEKFGKMDRWQLIDFVMHQLPEWEDPHGSAIPIEYKDILRAGGKTPQEMTSILGELEYLQSSHDILGNG
jgi:hypothetical protein